MKKTIAILLTAVLLCAAVMTALATTPEHYMGLWHYRRNSEHKSFCKTCGYVMYVPCEERTYEYDGRSITLCPVCGHIGDKDGIPAESSVLVYDYANSPVGEICVHVYEAPFEGDESVLYALTSVFEKAGQTTAYRGKANIGLSLALPDGARVITADGEEIAYSYDAASGVLQLEIPDCEKLYLIVK